MSGCRLLLARLCMASRQRITALNEDVKPGYKRLEPQLQHAILQLGSCWATAFGFPKFVKIKGRWMDRWTDVADSLDALVVSESICSLGIGLGLITPSWVPPTVVTHLLHCHGHLPKPFGEGQAALPRPALALAIESERKKSPWSRWDATLVVATCLSWPSEHVPGGATHLVRPFSYLQLHRPSHRPLGPHWPQHLAGPAFGQVSTPFMSQVARPGLLAQQLQGFPPTSRALASTQAACQGETALGSLRRCVRANVTWLVQMRMPSQPRLRTTKESWHIVTGKD